MSPKRGHGERHRKARNTIPRRRSRGACRKIAYKTRAKATKARRSQTHLGGFKIYRCDICSQWHLTSRT